MRVAELSIFLFDLGEAILPSRPQFDCAAVSSGGQGWPPLGGHPKGLSLTVASTVASFVTRGSVVHGSEVCTQRPQSLFGVRRCGHSSGSLSVILCARHNQREGAY